MYWKYSVNSMIRTTYFVDCYVPRKNNADRKEQKTAQADRASGGDQHLSPPGDAAHASHPDDESDYSEDEEQ